MRQTTVSQTGRHRVTRNLPRPLLCHLTLPSTRNLTPNLRCQKMQRLTMQKRMHLISLEIGRMHRNAPMYLKTPPRTRKKLHTTEVEDWLMIIEIFPGMTSQNRQHQHACPGRRHQGRLLLHPENLRLEHRNIHPPQRRGSRQGLAALRLNENLRLERRNIHPHRIRGSRQGLVAL